MLQPASRHDWWIVPIPWTQALDAEIPGVLPNDNKTCLVHRSHLPLFRAVGFPVPALQDAPQIDGARGVTFRAWQRRAYAWAKPRRGTLITAEPRMGKTALSLTLHDPARGPLVVLAPLDVRQVWLDWIERVFPGAEVLCLEGRTVDAKAIREAAFIFCHYDIAMYQQVISLVPGTLIIDEAHLLANANSQRSKAVRDFAVLAKVVITLSGTPLWNATKGLWPLMAMTNPGAWGQKPFLFNQRYCSPVIGEYGWVYGEISNEEEWLARQAEVVFQADWATERPDLQPTQRTFVDVDIDAAAYGELDIAAESLRDVTLQDTTIGAIARYRKVAAHLKVPAVAEAALEEPTPAVTWSWHKDVAKAIATTVRKRGRSVYLIHGDEPVRKRLAAIEAWRDDPGGVLSATLAVAQVGLDFSHAARAYFAEVDWTPAVLYQGEMRTFDPDRVMRSVFFRVRHPVEQMLVDKLVAKLARGVASAMPAAGSGFDLSTTGESEDVLLARLNEIVSGGAAFFR